MQKKEKVFVSFLEIAGFQEFEALVHYEKFRKSDEKMEEYSKKNLAGLCRTPFLKNVLMRFSRVYDDPAKRKRIEEVIETEETGVKGDLHIHTEWSDGSYPIEEVVEKAEEFGYEYLAITDHSLVGKGRIEMDGERFLEQISEIERIQKRHQVRILKGVELDINSDGRLDYPGEILEKADVVLGSVHFDYGLGTAKALELLRRLLESEHVDIVAHPLNRIGIDLFRKNFGWIAETAKKNKKALEINLFPDRMEEIDLLADLLADSGVMLSFGTDSHSVRQMEMMRLSKLWSGTLDPKAILNAYSDPIAALKGEEE